MMRVFTNRNTQHFNNIFCLKTLLYSFVSLYEDLALI